LEVVRCSYDLTNRAVDLSPACEQHWQPAARELRTLLQKLRPLEVPLGEAARGAVDLDGVKRQLEGKAALLADNLIPSLRRLDELVSGKNERGEALPAPGDENLPPRLREVRNLVFAFVNRFGGWEEYRVEEGDPVANHGRNLQVVDAPKTVGRLVVRAILHPGYRKQNYSIKGPRVYVSG
jgi:hypothetical protein